MATIGGSTVQGVYITKDVGGSIAANNPGSVELAGLTLGRDYIYLDSIIRLEHRLSFTTEGDDFVAHNLAANDAGQTGHYTGEADKGFFTLVAEVDLDDAAYCEQFGKYNNRQGYDGGATDPTSQKYLIRQYAAASFRQFPNHLLSFKKAVPVVISGVSTTEIEGILDRMEVIIGMWETW